jgi:endothelin-converting enzyme/putative endopeptidase
VISVGPGAVGLPDRDYYVSEDADSKEKKTKIRSSYCEDVRVSREKPAEAKVHAEQILALEMRCHNLGLTVLKEEIESLTTR